MSTETEQFWAGHFGNDYLQRNQVEWEKRVPFFQNIHRLTKMQSVLDVGCNAGWSLRAIHKLDMTIELAGCDVNETALEQADMDLPMADLEIIPANHLRDFYTEWSYDLVMTAGVLIHIPPEEIKSVMKQIVELSNGYVLAVEYDHVTQQEVDYRGHKGKLWRRPYGYLYTEMGLQLVWVGRVGQDEGFGEGCTAWLMKKPS